MLNFGDGVERMKAGDPASPLTHREAGGMG